MRVVANACLLFVTTVLVGDTSLMRSKALGADWSAQIGDQPAAAVSPKPRPQTAGTSAPPAAPAAPPNRLAGPKQATATALPQSLYLVRSTLLALHDANRTGNYTVLRDLSAPSVRNRSSSADLATVFAGLRRSNLDLSIAALGQPEFDGPPMLDAARRLHLKGEYATQPNRIVFEIVYEVVDGHWMMSDLSIATRPTAKSASAAP